LTKLQNYLTFDQATNARTNQTTVSNFMNNFGFARFLQLSNVLLAGFSNHRYDNLNLQLARYEHLHFYATNAVSAAILPANGSIGPETFIFNVKLPLNLIYDSIYALNKSLYFDQIIVLKIVLNGTNKFMFITNRANLTNPAAASVTIFTYTIIIHNILLYLAVKQNLAIESELRAKVYSAEGLKMFILYIYTNKVGLSVFFFNQFQFVIIEAIELD
jgi:hypothetical protein